MSYHKMSSFWNVFIENWAIFARLIQGETNLICWSMGATDPILAKTSK